MRRLSVLVVDDDPISLEVTRERLARAGYQVTTRELALGTSSWIFENQPDVVLLDVMMPALSGQELALLLKRRGMDTAIVLHSSKDALELAQIARETGAAGAIQKTANEAAFLREFEGIIAGVVSHRKRSLDA